MGEPTIVRNYQEAVALCEKELHLAREWVKYTANHKWAPTRKEHVQWLSRQ